MRMTTPIQTPSRRAGENRGFGGHCGPDGACPQGCPGRPLWGAETAWRWPVAVAVAAGPEWPHFLRVVTLLGGPALAGVRWGGGLS